MPDRAQRMCSFSLSSIGADSSKYLQQTQQISYAHLATLVILCCWLVQSFYSLTWNKLQHKPFLVYYFQQRVLFHRKKVLRNPVGGNMKFMQISSAITEISIFRYISTNIADSWTNKVSKPMFWWSKVTLIAFLRWLHDDLSHCFTILAMGHGIENSPSKRLVSLAQRQYYKCQRNEFVVTDTNNCISPKVILANVETMGIHMSLTSKL